MYIICREFFSLPPIPKWRRRKQLPIPHPKPPLRFNPGSFCQHFLLLQTLSTGVRAFVVVWFGFGFWMWTSTLEQQQEQQQQQQQQSLQIIINPLIFQQFFCSFNNSHKSFPAININSFYSI
ncbi:Hypothetical predicted protein [Drosophila guanche]|uniref:Uncharacterized protein n=1 Tax=Drosophila guanche TaxID=7266 RepID=A0A3B0JP40_DROGU|nr:Hypothetical predicted protein [Drosophila guanche]